MKQYLYNYQTIVRFEGDVGTHSVKLRCQPCINACQKIVREELMLHPSEFKLYTGQDAFGNRTLYGSTLEPHDSLAYISSGVVELDWYRIPASQAEPYYKCHTNKTRTCKEMLQHKPFRTTNPLDIAMDLCHYVYSQMEYIPNTTDMHTTASEAFCSHRGVCQDYSHILIALCRHYGIPARYVNGFIAGEGATHAWVEIYDGEAWWGIDPTHDTQIFMGYIKVAHGRDADDCPVSRGCYVGSANQQTEINVIVNEL